MKRLPIALLALCVAGCAASVSDQQISGSAQFITIASENTGPRLDAPMIYVFRHKRSGHCFVFATNGKGVSLIETAEDVCRADKVER